MVTSGHGSVAHRVKLPLMVHIVPGSNPAWDFLLEKREGGFKPPEWLLDYKSPSLILVPSLGLRGCYSLCLAHVRMCCIFHACQPPLNWYLSTFYNKNLSNSWSMLSVLALINTPLLRDRILGVCTCVWKKILIENFFQIIFKQIFLKEF